MQSLFSKWVRENYNQSAAFELKLCKGRNALPYNAFQPQQLPMLYKAKHGCVYKKLSDLDPSLKPFDCLQICYSPAFVVVMWYTPRQPKEALLIDIDVFLAERDSSLRKSLTEQRARELAQMVITL